MRFAGHWSNREADLLQEGEVPNMAIFAVPLPTRSPVSLSETAPGSTRRSAHGAAAHRCGRRPPRPGGEGRLRPGGGAPPASRRPEAGPRGRERRPRAVARPSRASPSRAALRAEAPPTAAWTRRRRSRKPSRRDHSRQGRGLQATPGPGRRVRQALHDGAVFRHERGGRLQPRP